MADNNDRIVLMVIQSSSQIQLGVTQAVTHSWIGLNRMSPSQMLKPQYLSFFANGLKYVYLFIFKLNFYCQLKG